MRARPGRSPRRPVAAAMAIAALWGCARDVTVAPPPVLARGSPPPQEPECAPIVLDSPDGGTPDEGSAATATRSPGPLIDLAMLVRPDGSKRGPRKRIDLGHVSAHVEPRPPGEWLDIPMTDLPRALPRADLPADLQHLWDRDDGTRHELLLVMLRRTRLDRKRSACKEASCTELACLEKRREEIDDEARRVRERAARERRELSASLRQHLAALGDRASAGAILALAGTLDEIARVDGDSVLSSTDLAEPIALYRRAAALAGPDSDAGWFARYRLAAALDDTNAREEAEAMLLALAGASPTALRIADAAYHAGSLEQAPGRAADLFARAAAMAPRGSGIHEMALRMGSQSALAAERPVDALSAGLLMSEEAFARDPEEWDDQIKEAAEVVGAALGRLLAGRPSPSLPRLPATAFAPIAARVAREALDHFDLALAVRAWEAIVAQTPDAAEAPEAIAWLAAVRERAGRHEEAAALRARAPHPPPTVALPPAVPERADLARRLAALARDCAHTHLLTSSPLAFEVQVASDAPRPAKVTAHPVLPDSPTNLTRCLTARGPAYFVDAPADLRVTLTLTTADDGAAIGTKAR